MVSVLWALAAVCVASAPLAAAQSVTRKTNVAVAKCNIVAATDSSSQSAEVLASVAGSTAAFVCNQDYTTSDAERLIQSRDIASVTAEAFARAVASITVDCYLSGQASVTINGRSAVMASAFSIAQAYVEAVVDADACDKCEATAKLVAEQNEQLWLEAVAIAEVRVVSMTYPGMSRSIWIEEFVETVKKGVTSAFAEVLVGSFGSTEDGCVAQIIGRASVDANALDDRAPSTFDCNITVGANDFSFGIDAVANATKQTVFYACEDDVNFREEIVAKEIATAIASALASVSLQCEVATDEHVSGSGVVCAYGAAQSAAVAEASAFAWAEAYVKALAQCPQSFCVTDSGGVAEEVAKIMLNAYAKAIGAACANNNETFDVKKVESETAADSIAAVARILLSARIVWYGQECDAAAEFSAFIVGAPTPGRIPTPLPILPADVSNTPFPTVVPTIVKIGGSVTKSGSATVEEGFQEVGTVVNTTAFEFTEVGVALEPCGEGVCVTNYGQCSGEFRGRILETALPCCGKVFECRKQSSKFGLCMPIGQDAPPDWDGEVLAGYCGY